MRRSARRVSRNGGPFVRARPFLAALLSSTGRPRSFARSSSVDSMKSALCISATAVLETPDRFCTCETPAARAPFPPFSSLLQVTWHRWPIPFELFVNESSRCRRNLHHTCCCKFPALTQHGARALCPRLAASPQCIELCRRSCFHRPRASLCRSRLNVTAPAVHMQLCK